MEALRIQEIKQEIKAYESKLKDKNISVTEVDQILQHIENMTIELEHELEKHTQEIQNKTADRIY
jgi:hypothetical protein